MRYDNDSESNAIYAQIFKTLAVIVKPPLKPTKVQQIGMIEEEELYRRTRIIHWYCTETKWK